MSRIRLFAGIVLVSALLSPPSAQTRAAARASEPSEHWVSTWATALLLAPPAVRRPPSGSASSGGATGAAPARTPGATRRAPASSGPPPHNLPDSFEDQTLRMIVRTSLGGRQLRISLSNMLNANPLRVGAAHLGLHTGRGAIEPASDRALTFGGQSTVIVPPGALVLSDPVDLEVAPLTDLAVSLYLPEATGAPSSHTTGMRTAYIANGNMVAQPVLPADAQTTTAYAWLSSVDVLAPATAFTIVALGDSITDGYATTVDGNRAWPALLARRLNGDARTRHIGVVNQGISGNQVLRNGAGLSMLARFDRDVLSRPGVKWLILLGGINDINIRGRFGTPPLTAEELIGGYEQIIARSRVHGIRVIGATLTPQEGQFTATEQGEQIRQAVNTWIRTSGRFDAVVDFDAAVRDPTRPQRLNPAFDPGDHIHPNDAGNAAMAAAFDLGLFGR